MRLVPRSPRDTIKIKGSCYTMLASRHGFAQCCYIGGNFLDERAWLIIQGIRVKRGYFNA